MIIKASAYTLTAAMGIAPAAQAAADCLNGEAKKQVSTEHVEKQHSDGEETHPDPPELPMAPTQLPGGFHSHAQVAGVTNTNATSSLVFTTNGDMIAAMKLASRMGVVVLPRG
jgi:hypothetical protein